MNVRQRLFVLAEVIVGMAFIFAVIVGIVAPSALLSLATWLIGVLLCAWAGATAAAFLWLIPWLLNATSSKERESIVTFISVGILIGLLLALLAATCAPYDLKPIYILSAIFGLAIGMFGTILTPDTFVGREVPAAVVGLSIGGGLVTAITLKLACLMATAILIAGVGAGVVFLLLVAAAIAFHQAVMATLGNGR